MTKMRDEHGIIGNEIFGFESMACNSRQDHQSLDMHPGFKLMVKVLNTNVDDVEAWIREGNIQTCRKGLLWKYIESTDPSRMTRAQLVSRVREMMMEKHQSAADNSTAVVENPKPSSSSTTLNVLMTYRRDKDARDTMKRLIKLEKTMNKAVSFDGSGEIYAAWNPLMPNLHKLGFTFQNAETRVKALQTAGVLESFELVRHAHVPDARYVFNLFCLSSLSD